MVVVQTGGGAGGHLPARAACPPHMEHGWRQSCGDLHVVVPQGNDAATFVVVVVAVTEGLALAVPEGVEETTAVAEAVAEGGASVEGVAVEGAAVAGADVAAVAVGGALPVSSDGVLAVDDSSLHDAPTAAPVTMAAPSAYCAARERPAGITGLGRTRSVLSQNGQRASVS
jgi:hypothetical protein